MSKRPIDTNNLAADIGKRIRISREKAGLTQDKLSEITGIDSKHISVIENGKKIMQVDTFVKICNALEVDYTYIISGNAAIYKDKELQKKLTLLSERQFDTLCMVIDTFLDESYK